jgi:hypothetical protein
LIRSPQRNSGDREEFRGNSGDRNSVDSILNSFSSIGVKYTVPRIPEVEKVNGPGGTDGDDWYRYVLARGISRVTGFHRGTLVEVTEYAAESAAAFNERSLRGKSVYAYAWQRKK